MISPLFKYQNLMRELLVRDLRTRYVGSVLGFFWSILNPLLQLALYTTVFSVILGLRFENSGPNAGFAAFLFCALLPWMALQESVTRSARVFIEHRHLIGKARFPLEVLPFTNVASATLHQLIGTIIFTIILLANRSLQVDLFGLLLLLLPAQVLMAYGLSVVTACLTVFIRDVTQILGVGFMLLFWLTPIVYPKSRALDAPEAVRWLLDLNPLTHMIEGYRFAFFGTPELWWPGQVYWLLFCLFCYWAGSRVLKRTRRDLVDML